MASATLSISLGAFLFLLLLLPYTLPVFKIVCFLLGLTAILVAVKKNTAGSTNQEWNIESTTLEKPMIWQKNFLGSFLIQLSQNRANLGGLCGGPAFEKPDKKISKVTRKITAHVIS